MSKSYRQASQCIDGGKMRKDERDGNTLKGHIGREKESRGRARPHRLLPQRQQVPALHRRAHPRPHQPHQPPRLQEGHRAGRRVCCSAAVLQAEGGPVQRPLQREGGGLLGHDEGGQGGLELGDTALRLCFILGTGGEGRRNERYKGDAGLVQAEIGFASKRASER